MIDARSEPSQDKRLALQREANALIAEDASIAPFIFGKFLHIYSERIKHYHMNPEETVDWSTVEVID